MNTTAHAHDLQAALDDATRQLMGYRAALLRIAHEAGNWSDASDLARHWAIESGGWVQVLRAHEGHSYPLHAEDYLYFFGK